MARVLVVDDEPDIRDSLVDILGYAGYEMLEAEDGGEGFEKASSQQPDIILLDVMMPVMDGFETLKKLRENPATKTIPVIMLTAISAARGEQAGLELGISKVMPVSGPCIGD